MKILNFRILFFLIISLSFLSSVEAQNNSTVSYVSYLEVDQSSIGKAVDLLLKYADHSLKNPDNLHMEILQHIYRPNQFVVLDSWQDQASRRSHIDSSTTHEFRNALKPMLTAGYDEHEQMDVDVDDDSGDGSIYVITHVDFMPPQKDKGTEILKAVAPEIRKAKGNNRFNIIAQPRRSNHLTVVEVWQSEEAFAEHSESPLFKNFRHSIQPLMGSLYDERLYSPAHEKN